MARKRNCQTLIHNAAVTTAFSMMFLAAARSALADDLATVEQRVETSLINSDPSTSTVKGYMSSLNSNGSWSDIDYGSTANTSWTPLTDLTRLEAMAEAYSDSSSSLYQSSTLKSDILSNFNYWIAQDPQSVNWFYNDIDTPQELSNVMVLMNGVLSSSQRSAGLAIIARADEPRSDNSSENAGDNRVLRAMAEINQGIISGSSSMTNTAFAAIGDTLAVTTGDGIQADGSFHQHGAQLYNSGYGSDFASDVVTAVSLGAGTSFAFTSSQDDTLIDYLLDGTQWMVRGQVIDYTASGRDITRKNQDTSAKPLEAELKSLISDNLGYRTAELQAFEANIQSSNATGSQNPSLALSGNKEFWESDFMVTQRPSYYASVTLSSVNTTQPETGNGEGLQNLYLADGVNLIMQTGNEYDNIMPVWNWRRLPGTTVEQNSRSLTPSADFGVAGTSTFAGGVSDGTYGASAFAYNQFNVKAKKSWFFFDNEFTALGAGIDAANSTSEVDTTINQTLLNGTVSYKTTGNSSVQTLSLGHTVTPSGLQWVLQDGIGYYFPTAVSNATIMALTQTGTWSSINQRYDNTQVSQNVFTLYLDHGTGFTGGSYDYIVVPNMTVSEMETYVANNPIDVLSNTATVQAVRQTTLDVTQAAFYSASSVNMGSGQSFSVSDPSTIMMQRPVNSFTLTASSPADAVIPLSISLSGVKFSGSGSSWLDGFTQSATVVLGLPSGDLAGSSVGAAITTDGAASPTIKFTTTNSPTIYSYTSTADLALAANTTLYAGSNKTLTFNGVISGNKSLTKDGDSALNLGGSNTYTGGTTILDGVISVTGDQRTANGGWNIGPDSDNATTVTFQSGSQLKIASGNSFNVGNNTPNGEIEQQVFAQGSVVNNGSLSLGRYANLRVTGTWTQAGGVSISGYGQDTYSPVLAVNDGGSFTYTGTSNILINPASNSTASASLIIGNSDGAGTFTTGQGFEQDIAGAGGNGIVTIRYGSSLILSGNVSQLTTGGVQFSIGDNGGIINTNGFYAGVSSPISNVTNSTGGLTKSGAGTLELFTAGSYLGDTTVTGGSLKVSNTTGSATGSGTVYVASGGTLTGNGIISGPTNIESGGTISPGDSVGTLTTGDQTWSGKGQYVFQIASVDDANVSQTKEKGITAGADWLKVNGSLTISATAANTFTFDIVGLNAGDSDGPVDGWDQTKDYTWTLASASDGISGFSAGKLSLDVSNFIDDNAATGTWSITNSGNNLLLNYTAPTAVPEPSGLAAIISTFCLLSRRRRRKSPASPARS